MEITTGGLEMGPLRCAFIALSLNSDSTLLRVLLPPPHHDANSHCAPMTSQKLRLPTDQLIYSHLSAADGLRPTRLPHNLRQDDKESLCVIAAPHLLVLGPTAKLSLPPGSSDEMLSTYELLCKSMDS